MSEYQRYEFLAIDRPLTEEERRRLRAISSRADITAFSFTNEYQWGDLKADPAKLMEQYFDVFVYVANWGTHRLMLRLPAAALEDVEVSQYCVTSSVNASRVNDLWLLDLTYREDGGIDDWEDRMEGWMTSLAPIRAELLQGDLRPLYLAWLATAPEEVSDESLEPLVPPGLQQLSSAQQSLAEFLALDPALLEVAAETSPPYKVGVQELNTWISNLPLQEKDRLLIEVAAGRGASVAGELLRGFRSSPDFNRGDQSAISRRTVGSLLEQAHQRRELRALEAKQRAAAEKARKEAQAAATYARHLDALAGRVDVTWETVSQLVSSGQSKAYDQAVSHLMDLRALHERASTLEPYRTRLAALVTQYGSKRSFLQRVKEARLDR